MPLSINVGLSRKASRNFQSTGCSINVTAELDQSLLARPEELQQQIASLYGQAGAALARQAAQGPSLAPPRPRRRLPVRGARDPQSPPAPATASQQRAIQAICRDLGTGPDRAARQFLGLSCADLSVKQASDLIDRLKSAQPSGAVREGGAP